MTKSTRSAPKAEGPSEMRYADAIQELETILDQLDQADIDVDALSASVERAASLLKLCRNRITRAEVRIKEILADMEDNADSSSPAPETES